MECDITFFFFNIVPQKIIKKIRELSNERIYVDLVCIKVLGFADDLNIIEL